MKTEGLISLVKSGAAFLIYYSKRSIFRYETHYLYIHEIGQLNEADFMPRMQDFTHRVVSTSQQASELAANGFEDFRTRFYNARRRLDCGAIAFYIFYGKELAYLGWMATNEKAKRAIDSLSYKVCFAGSQACIGDTFTVPEYRRKGLMTYGYFRRFDYLKEQGFTSLLGSINASNIAPQAGYTKFDAAKYAKARLIKILWWRYWKEMPIEHTDLTKLSS